MAHGGGDRHDYGIELLTALFVPVPGRGGGTTSRSTPWRFHTRFMFVKYLLAVSHSLHTRPRTGGARHITSTSWWSHTAAPQPA